MAGRQRPVSVVFDRVADRYDETRGGQARADMMADLLVPLLPGSGPLLELAVGTAIVAATIAGRSGRPVIGIDLSRPMLEVGRPRLPGRLIHGDVTTLPIRTASLDAACALWILHLVGDPQAMLDEAARTLRKGGRLVVVGRGESRSDEDVDRIVDAVEHELRPGVAETPDDISPLARRAHLQIVDVVETGHQSFGTTPRQAVERYESQTWSFTWDLEPATRARVLDPAIAALRALPDQDRPRQRVGLLRAMVLDRV